MKNHRHTWAIQHGTRVRWAFERSKGVGVVVSVIQERRGFDDGEYIIECSDGQPRTLPGSALSYIPSRTYEKAIRGGHK